MAHSCLRRTFLRPWLERLEDRTLLATAVTPAVQSLLSQQPLSFEANVGQTDARVDFIARGAGYGMYLTPGDTVLDLRRPAATAGDTSASAVVQMQLVGANTAAPVRGLDQLPGITNYFIGDDPAKWHTDVHTYAKVEYQNVYPGVNVVYYGNQNQLEYDFVVAPGAHPGTITLAFQGTQQISLNDQGELVLHTDSGDVIEHAPVAYQTVDGARRDVAGHYVLEGDGKVGFAVGAYDAMLPLVIDPVLAYSTYLGGSGDDECFGVATDASGNAYITGYTYSTDFPLANPLISSFAPPGGSCAFVTKFSPTGSLLYSTFLGGTLSGFGDVGRAIAVDASGAYVTGWARDPTFPVTAGAFQTSFGSGGAFRADAFVSKLSPAGNALLYSTFIHGEAYDEGMGIALLGGFAYVTGDTSSLSFPTTAGVVQPTSSAGHNSFVTELNQTGSALVYSSYVGGSLGSTNTTAIAVDASGSAYVTGDTSNHVNFPITPGAFQSNFRGIAATSAFVLKLNPTGTAYTYATLLGGSQDDRGNGIVVDSNGFAYVEGLCSSTDFPTTSGAYQTSPGGAFVTKMNQSGSSVVYSTYLGTSTVSPGGVDDYDSTEGIAIDSSGDAYTAGYTFAADWPLKNPVQTNFGSVYVSELNPTGSQLLFSTYLGSGSFVDRGLAVAVDLSNNIYVVGEAQAGFPTKNAFQASWHGGPNDAFVAEIGPGTAPPQPIITALSPGSVAELSAGFALAVTGINFLNPSTVLWNNTTLTTTFVDSAHLQATVPASLLSEEGSANISVTTSAGTSGTKPFTITDPVIVAQGTPPIIETPGTSTGPIVVATFTDPGGAEALSNYSASINWGDGSAATTGSISLSSNTFSVTGSHTFAPGSFFVTVTIQHEANAPVIVGTITNPPVLTGVGSPIPEGSTSAVLQLTGSRFFSGSIVLWNNSPIATTFMDASHLQATVPAALVAEEGSASIVVSNTVVISNAMTVSISDPAIVVQGGATIIEAPGTSTGTVTVATFTDPGGNELSSSYSASIDWGDGSAPTAGTLSLANGTYQVTGSHTYTAPNSYTITVTVNHEANAPVSTTTSVKPLLLSGLGNNTAVESGAGLTLAVTGSNFLAGTVVLWNGTALATNIVDTGHLQAIVPLALLAEEGVATVSVKNGVAVSTTLPFTITDPAIVAQGSPPISAPVGTSTSGMVLATFTDPAGNEAVTSYNATIDWGDGSALSTGIVSLAGSTYQVTGNHVYLKAGTVTITISIQHEANAPVSVTTIANPPELLGLGVTSLSEASADTPFLVTGSNFLPGASVLWNGVPVFTTLIDAQDLQAVVPAKLLAEEGSASITVSSAGMVTSAMTLTVSDPPLTGRPGSPVTLKVDGSTGTFVLANFVDTGAVEAVSDYHASIDWGDGSTPSAGTVSLAATTYSVSGSHTYAKAAAHTITVTVQHGTAGTLSLTTYAVADPIAMFVNQLYHDLLNRPADDAGLAYWEGRIAGGVSRSDVALDFQASREFRSHRVQSFYHDYLHRDADAQGLGDWLTALEHGTTLDQVQADILASDEYFATRGGGTRGGFVDALYQDVMLRDSDARGHDAFVQLLGQESAQQVALVFITSPEGARVVLQDWYKTYLGRPADEQGLEDWVAYLNHVRDDALMLAQILGSAEYFARANS